MDPANTFIPRSSEQPTNFILERQNYRDRNQEQSINKIYKKLDICRMLENNNTPINVVNKKELPMHIETIKQQNENNLPHVLAVVRSKHQSYRNCTIQNALNLNDEILKELQKTNEIFFYVIYNYEDKENANFEFIFRLSEIDDRNYFITTLVKAASGDVVAQFNIGVCYQIGKGVKPDMSKAVYWFKKSADQGDHYAKYYLGCCYENGGGVKVDHEKAFALFNEADQLGNDEALVKIGDCYEMGLGIPQDYQKALEYFILAGEAGVGLAHYKLGKLFMKFEKYTEAADYFQRGSNSDCPHSQFELGSLYKFGFGVEKDMTKAMELWKLSAKRGVKDAQKALAEALK